MSYPFPGNIRELENWIERAVVFADGDTLRTEDLPEQLTDTPALVPESGSLEARVAGLETSLIRTALAERNGNKSAAARDLGITERNIRYKMKKYGL